MVPAKENLSKRRLLSLLLPKTMPSVKPDPSLPLLLCVSPLFYGAAYLPVVLILARSPTFGPLLYVFLMRFGGRSS
ncbi:hypothetical protein PRUPE_7G251200 [Prunus persica]|uniref:Transmembrane protein n=1 Tax=Prunus persica TaxID=3760 RepID=A0A251NGP5_PRUPE|nr:hypothetical protein PRUPE_7G251200 [Prunus persica]